MTDPCSRTGVFHAELNKTRWQAVAHPATIGQCKTTIQHPPRTILTFWLFDIFLLQSRNFHINSWCRPAALLKLDIRYKTLITYQTFDCIVKVKAEFMNKSKEFYNDNEDIAVMMFDINYGYRRCCWKLTNAENCRILERNDEKDECAVALFLAAKQRAKTKVEALSSWETLTNVSRPRLGWLFQFISAGRDTFFWSTMTNSLWHAFWGWAFWPIYQHSLGQGRTYIWFVDYFFLFHSILLKLWSQEDKYLILF